MRKGFSLVEMAVVLVIIGLLAASITSATKLVRVTSYNKLAKQAEEIHSALKNFVITYEALPGDMTNAESLWGTYNSSTNPTGTVNGDGDGLINQYVVSSNRESLRAWQQLYKAEVLRTNYTGAEGSTVATDIEIGVNVPDTALTNVGAQIMREATYGATSNWYYKGGNFLQFAKEVIRDSGATEYLMAASFTNKDTYIYDNKFDDGVANTGTVRGAYGRELDDSGWTSCDYSSISGTDLTCIIAIRYGYF